MSNCARCGAVLPDGAASCPVCGSNATFASPVQPQQSAQPGFVQQGEPPKKKKKALKIVLVAILCLLVLVGISRCVSCDKQEKRLEPWPQGELAQMLPPMDRQCESVYEFDDGISIRVSEKVDRGFYDAYVASCEEKGFTEEAKKSTDGYEAFNADGYKLKLTLWDGEEPAIDIDLDAPKANGALAWPTTGLATLIPNPEKEKGSVAVDSSTQFTAYVGGMSDGEFSAYVDKCIEAGFNVDYNKGDASFNAKNSDGTSLHLKKEGFSVMYISMSGSAMATAAEPSGSEAQAPEPEPEPEMAPAAGSSSGVDLDFKAALDEYESFMDGYIDFMTTYSESDNVVAMAVDYAKWMGDYADMAEKIEAIDDGTLNAEEAAYYAEVMTRVSGKLADAAISLQ